MEKLTFSIIIIAFSFLACKKNTSNAYEGCCGTPPLVAKIDNVPIYVPNVYTPNYDGINDGIAVFTGGTVGQISDFIIKNKQGVEVWRNTKNINPNELFIILQADQNKIPEGVVSYTFKIMPASGTSVTFQGNICKNTSTGDDCPAKNKDCFYSVQNNNGVLDKVLPSGEACK